MNIISLDFLNNINLLSSIFKCQFKGSQNQAAEAAEEGTIGRRKRGRPKGSKTRTITDLEVLSRTNSIPASQMYITNRARARGNWYCY